MAMRTHCWMSKQELIYVYIIRHYLCPIDHRQHEFYPSSPNKTPTCIRRCAHESRTHTKKSPHNAELPGGTSNNTCCLKCATFITDGFICMYEYEYHIVDLRSHYGAGLNKSQCVVILFGAIDQNVYAFSCCSDIRSDTNMDALVPRTLRPAIPIPPNKYLSTQWWSHSGDHQIACDYDIIGPIALDKGTFLCLYIGGDILRTSTIIIQICYTWTCHANA